MKARELNLFTLAETFADEDKARQLIESRLWPNGPICPFCGHTKVYEMRSKEGAKNPMPAGTYKCAACRKRFTVRVGTIFEESPLPLRKWLMAMHLMTSCKKGISSHQLSRELKVTIKTAWFLSHRIREAMTEKTEGLLGGTVECDETGSTKPCKRGRGTDKASVLVLVERNGRARTSRIDRVTGKELKGTIKAHVDPDSKIVTDEFPSYRGSEKHFFGGRSIVHHSSENYVNEEGEHVNTAEGFFGLLKRGHYGIFHSLSTQHLFRCCNEFGFRWNHRKDTDGERMVAVLKGAEVKRLMFRTSGVSGN